jgi:hypothetical protein
MAMDANNRVLINGLVSVDSSGNVGMGTTSTQSNFTEGNQIYRHDTTVTANFTATVNDYYIEANATSAGFTVTLPTAANFYKTNGSGYPDFRAYAAELHVIRIDAAQANTLTITAQSGQTINGSLTYLLNPGQAVEIHATSTTTWIID